jgi:hypothetical protein
MMKNKEGIVRLSSPLPGLLTDLFLLSSLPIISRSIPVDGNYTVHPTTWYSLLSHPVLSLPAGLSFVIIIIMIIIDRVVPRMERLI